MIVFSKNDFEKDGVSFLSFDDNFEFDDSNKIIFGFNGIGKTSIYNYLKKTQKDNYNFLIMKINRNLLVQERKLQFQ